MIYHENLAAGFVQWLLEVHLYIFYDYLAVGHAIDRSNSGKGTLMKYKRLRCKTRTTV